MTLVHVKVFALGYLISILNWLALTWAWQRIFKKKSIAFALAVIVLKYALLTLLVWYVVSRFDSYYEAGLSPDYGKSGLVLAFVTGIVVGLISWATLLVQFERRRDEFRRKAERG